MSEHDDEHPGEHPGEPNDGLSDDALRALLPPLQPPRDFANRVLLAHAAASAPRALPPAQRRRWAPLLMAAATGALAASVLLSLPRPTPAVDGTAEGTIATADRRRVIDVDGAHITLLPHTTMQVDHDAIAIAAGEAFFRVEPRDADAPPFVLTTPGGDVVVTGTCFTVSVPESPMLAHHDPRSLAVGATIGALVGVIATVVVHEGTVTLRNDHGSVALVAGERGQLLSSSPPTATDSMAAARARLATVLSTVEATEAAIAGDTRQLVTENARLRAMVERREEELALLDAEHKERDGEPLPFPADLPPRFSQAALLSSITAAFKDSGIAGDVTAIDCAEYPCIVWGETQVDTSTLTEQLGKSSAFAAYADDGKHVRGWGSGKGNSELFAMTLTPNTPPLTDEQKTALNKRVRARAEAGFEANKPASWSEQAP
jgi:ferric-dicitrate binding protein FerR (iron transport regulator)